MTKCEKYDSLLSRDICSVMSRKNQMWSEFIEHSQPKIKCPFNVPSIKLTNAYIDLGIVSHLPLDGYIWLTTLKIYKSTANIRLKKVLLFCMTCEATITRARRQRGNK